MTALTKRRIGRKTRHATFSGCEAQDGLKNMSPLPELWHGRQKSKYPQKIPVKQGFASFSLHFPCVNSPATYPFRHGIASFAPRIAPDWRSYSWLTTINKGRFGPMAQKECNICPGIFLPEHDSLLPALPVYRICYYARRRPCRSLSAANRWFSP